MKTCTGRVTVVRRVATAVVTAGALLLLQAVPASAASSYIGSNSGGANVRTCPSTGCASKGFLPNGTGVSMTCWIDTAWVYPPSSDYPSPRWFGAHTPKGWGYVHSSLVENQTGVGHC